MTNISDVIQDLLKPDANVDSVRAISGGDINEAYLVALNDGSKLFLKANSQKNICFFEAEKTGLSAIRDTNTIRVPEVLKAGTAGGRSYLLMEYLEAAPRKSDYWEHFGWQLAAMQRLLDGLDKYLIEPEYPSLLHGDLWGGNFVTGPDGYAWLIDPAVYVGAAEADLAMTELFGGFAPAFYETSREAGTILPGYEDRREIYNLYHLLNHLNLFGGGYYGAVMRTVRRYAG